MYTKVITGQGDSEPDKAPASDTLTTAVILLRRQSAQEVPSYRIRSLGPSVQAPVHEGQRKASGTLSQTAWPMRFCLVPSISYHGSWVPSATEDRAPPQTHLLHLGQLPCVLVVSKILLVPNQDDGHVGTEMLDFRSPFFWGCFLKAAKCIIWGYI